MTKIEKVRLTINFIANMKERGKRRQKRSKFSGIFKY